MSDIETRKAKARATRARNKVVEPIAVAFYKLFEEFDDGYGCGGGPRDYGSPVWVQRVRKLNAELTNALFSLEQYDYAIQCRAAASPSRPEDRP